MVGEPRLSTARTSLRVQKALTRSCCRRPVQSASRSLGRDGSVSTNSYTPGVFIGTDYNQDIVWSDGYFVRSPGGVNRAYHLSKATPSLLG